MGNEIITTSAFSVDLEKSSAGRNHYCPACERSCNMVARIMRWGRLGHQLRQMLSGMKTSMMAMHDNVQFMLVKLRLKADIYYAICGTGHAEGSLVRSGFILKMYGINIYVIVSRNSPIHWFWKKIIGPIVAQLSNVYWGPTPFT